MTHEPNATKRRRAALLPWAIAVLVAIIVAFAWARNVARGPYSHEHNLAYLRDTLARSAIKYIDQNGHAPDRIDDALGQLEAFTWSDHDLYGSPTFYMRTGERSFKIHSAGKDRRYKNPYNPDDPGWGDDINITYDGQSLHVNNVLP
jgi:hypothetical protein